MNYQERTERADRVLRERLAKGAKPMGAPKEPPSALTGLTHDFKCKTCKSLLRDSQARDYRHGILSVLKLSSRPCWSCQRLPSDEDIAKQRS
jgi:hypothetical protein